MLLAASGMLGAACGVGMFAAVTFGKVQAEQLSFCIVNGIGSILILVGSAHEFDAGTAAQALIWALVSFLGALCALRRNATPGGSKNTARSVAAQGWRCPCWPAGVLVADFDRGSNPAPQPFWVVSALVFWAGVLAIALLLSGGVAPGQTPTIMQVSLGILYLMGIWVSLSRKLTSGADARRPLLGGDQASAA